MSYQKLIIVGNLGRDPEMRYTPDGTPVTNLNIATNRKWNNSDGSQGEETIWFRVSVWRRWAEIAAEYLHKGNQVMVEGRLHKVDKDTGGPKIWTRRDGTAGASFEVTCDRLILLSNRGDAGSGPGPSEDDGGGGADYIPEDDIPF